MHIWEIYLELQQKVDFKIRFLRFKLKCKLKIRFLTNSLASFKAELQQKLQIWNGGKDLQY